MHTIYNIYIGIYVSIHIFLFVLVRQNDTIYIILYVDKLKKIVKTID